MANFIKKKVSILCRGLVTSKSDPEFVCLCVYQWSGERGQNILDKATFLTDNRKKWEKHLERVEEQCKPRGSKLVTATQYKVLTRGGVELPEYIEKCRRITDACGWPEEAKDMALRNAILLDLKNQNVYQKCLEEDLDSLTADELFRLPLSFTTVTVITKDRLCSPSVQQRRQPSNKVHRNNTQSANKALKIRKIGRGAKQRQDSEN